MKKQIIDLWSGGRTTIGTIYSSSSWADLSAFTNSGSTSSASGGEIAFSGGANTFTQSLGLTNCTNLKKWTQTVRARVGTKNGTSYGFGVGIRSTNSQSIFSDCIAKFNMDTGANSGKVSLFVDTTHTETLSGSALSFSVNDVIELSITFNAETESLSATATNITAGGSVSVSYTFTYLVLYPNVGRYSIFSFGGSFNVTSYSVTSTEIYQPDYLLVGDSKTARYYASAYSTCWAALVKAIYPRTVMYAGGGDRTADILTVVTDITTYIKPRQIILAIGSNDIRSSVSSATWQANYASFAASMESAGIRVIHTNGFKEGVLDQSALGAYVKGTYPGERVIDTLATTLTLNADNIHPDNGGHATIAAQILGSSKINSVTSLLNKLVSYWTLDSDYTDTIGFNNGSAISTPTNQAGKINNGYLFSANTQGISITDVNNLSFGDSTTDYPFSYSFWIKPTNLTGSLYYIVKRIDVGSMAEYQITQNASGSGKIGVALFDRGGFTNYLNIDTVSTISAGVWSHIVVSYDGSKTATGIKVYINGTLSSNTDSSVNPGSYVAMKNGTCPLTFGRANTLGGFVGMIDEVGVWARALSQSEVTSLYNSGSGLPFSSFT